MFLLYLIMYSCEERRHLEHDYVNRTKLNEMLRVRLLNLKIDNFFLWLKLSLSLHQYCIYSKSFQFLLLSLNIYMLFTGREVRIGENCARGLEYGPSPQAEGRTQGRGRRFSLCGPI